MVRTILVISSNPVRGVDGYGLLDPPKFVFSVALHAKPWMDAPWIRIFGTCIFIVFQ